MAVIASAKRAMRKEIKILIEKLSKQEKKIQSAEVAKKFLALPQYIESKRISVYLSTEYEIDTLPILTHMFDSGKEVFVPRYEGREMCMLRLDSFKDYEKLPLTKWKIKQPAEKTGRDDALETGGLDLIILPGVAFTVSGKRLGHGMGYYDTFLEALLSTQAKKPHLIGIAFNQQIREDIPTAENDVSLDLIIHNG